MEEQERSGDILGSTRDIPPFESALDVMLSTRPSTKLKVKQTPGTTRRSSGNDRHYLLRINGQ
jgi:hypothetical protein